MKLVLDIETIPCADDVRSILPEPEPPGSVRDDELRLEEWRIESLPGLIEDQYRATALNASYGRVFCIGLMPFARESEAETLTALFGHDEKALLQTFWQKVQEWGSPYLITHNGLQFDLPFLWKRSVVNAVRPTMELKLHRYRTDYVFDTMAVWTNWDARGRMKLSELAGIFGVGEKGGSGADVYDLWKGQRYRDITGYCLHDVYLTYACYCRMIFGTPRPSNDLKRIIHEVHSPSPPPCSSGAPPGSG